jgi:integrase
MLIVTFADSMEFHGSSLTNMREERITRVSKEEDIGRIISHAKLKYAVAFSLIRDCGLRPVELGMLRVKDIDLETGEIYPTTAKHGAGRVLKMRGSTLIMLKKYVAESNLSPMDVLWNALRVARALNWLFPERVGKKYKANRASARYL